MRRTPPIKRKSSQDKSEEELYEKMTEKVWIAFIDIDKTFKFEEVYDFGQPLTTRSS
jgi:hypothetical protein